MECSKESLQEDSDKEYEPDKSPVSQVFRLIKSMTSSEKTPLRKQRKQKRLGRGPGGERDMDVDSEEDDDDSSVLSMIDIRARVMNAGWSEAVLMETISQVCSLLAGSGTLINYCCSSMRSWMSGFALQMARDCVLFKSVATIYLVFDVVVLFLCNL